MVNYFDVIVRLDYDQKKKAETLIKQIFSKWDKNVLCSISLFVNNNPPDREVLLALCYDLNMTSETEVIDWVNRRGLLLDNQVSLSELILKQKKGHYNTISGSILEHAWDQIIGSLWFG